MSVQPNNLNVAYGLSQALLNVFPSPIIALRDPGTGDKAQLGTVWVNKVDDTGFLLTSIVNNAAHWEAFSGGGVFNSLTVNGPTTLNGFTNINESNNANTNIGNPTGTGNTSIAGSLVGVDANTQLFIAGLQAPLLNIGVGQVTMTVDAVASNFTGPISSADPITITANSPTALHVTVGGIQSNDDIVCTSGSIVAAAGDVNCVALNLGGPIQVITGAGTPAGGLALHVGDLYINRTAATITTRLFIATAVGTWTNVVCAA